MTPSTKKRLSVAAARIACSEHLDDEAVEMLGNAIGFLIRNTGNDEQDARRLLLAVASRLPEQDRAKMEEEINAKAS